MTVTPDLLRITRIHMAIELIRGPSTQWPSRLIEMCDTLHQKWTSRFGPLDEIMPDLYGPGGRLYGIAAVGESRSRKAMESRWVGDPNVDIGPERPCEHGHLEFVPGQ